MTSWQEALLYLAVAVSLRNFFVSILHFNASLTRDIFNWIQSFARRLGFLAPSTVKLDGGNIILQPGKAKRGGQDGKVLINDADGNTLMTFPESGAEGLGGHRKA